MRQVVLFLWGKFIQPKLAVSSVTAPLVWQWVPKTVTIESMGHAHTICDALTREVPCRKRAPGCTTWGHNYCRQTRLEHLVGKSLANPSGLFRYVLISIEFDRMFIIFVVLSIVQTKISDWVSNLVHAQPIIRIDLYIHQ